jgi:pyruvate-ferredoxin/flavodoxin oxidoreductase
LHLDLWRKSADHAYAHNAAGRGADLVKFLFEDNAEFGLGMRLAVDKQMQFARELVVRVNGQLGDVLVKGLLEGDQSTEAGIDEQRGRVAELKQKLAGIKTPEAQALLAVADGLVRKSVWILGGDGWAYDIGFGGLDHVLGAGRNVNVLVLDTEFYSNTGGQMSKATPRAAVAKFATGGKRTGKKDLAMEALSYGYVYVAKVAMGGNDAHTVNAFLEAEAHEGPSIIIAYSHCIAHGYDMANGLNQQKNAVLSGYWPLMRYNPGLREQGKNPFQLDSKAPSIPFRQYAYNEARYTMLVRSNPLAARELLKFTGSAARRMGRGIAARNWPPPRRLFRARCWTPGGFIRRLVLGYRDESHNAAILASPCSALRSPNRCPYRSRGALPAHYARTGITPRARSASRFAGRKTRSPSRQTGAARSAGRRPVPFVCRASARGRAARPAG